MHIGRNERQVPSLPQRRHEMKESHGVRAAGTGDDQRLPGLQQVVALTKRRHFFRCLHFSS